MIEMDETHVIPLSENDLKRLQSAADYDLAHEHFRYRGTRDFCAVAKEICLSNGVDPGDRMLTLIVQDGGVRILRLSRPTATAPVCAQ